MERAKLEPRNLGGIAAENAERPLAEAWETAAGIPAFICLSPMTGVNGYVKVPAELRRDPRLEQLPANGGVTFADDAGWIGFDTGHGWDIWMDPEKPEDQMEAALREIGAGPMPASPHDNIWTLEKLRDAVEALALEVVALS